jgi:ABC-type sugar transport system ATPase subunit
VTLGVRPEDLALDDGAGVTGRVVLAERLGATTQLHLEVGPHRLVATLATDRDLAADAPISLVLDPARLHLFGPDGRALLGAPAND